MTGPLDHYLPPRDLWPQRIYTLPELHYPERLNTTEELLDKHVEAGRGERVAILFEDQRLTYAEVWRQVNRLASSLRRLGVREFDRVLIRCPNVPAAVISNFAVIKMGAISVPISPLLSPKEIAYVSNHAEAVAMVVSSALLPDVERVRDQLSTLQHIIVVGDSKEAKEKGFLAYSEMVGAGDETFSPVRHARDAVSVLLYTSGTTGPPKGTAHLMEETLAIADTFGRYGWRVQEDDVIGGPAPMAFAAGYGAVAVIPYRFGAAASLIARFTPEGMFEAIQKHRITILTVLPTSYRRMLQVQDAEKTYDLSSIRLCTGGGESLTAKTFHDWRARFGMEIYEGLGTTEMFYVFLSNTVTMRAKPGSVGVAVPGYEVKVVDEEGNLMRPGEIGRLLARGPTGTLYWRDPERQREVIVNGWNSIGDYVYADEGGYIWFVSREDDLIKSSGYRIGPEEIEEAMKGHPTVADVGVIGVPDPIRGQNAKAFVVLRPGYEPSDVLKEDLLNFLRGHIAVYKLPREITFVNELPRTVTGKLLRRVLREQEGVQASGS